MQTLEELNAHYKAVRARLNCGPQLKIFHPVIPMQIEPVVEVAPPPKLELVFEMPVFQSPAEKILIEVAERHEVTVKDIKSHSHKMKMVHARQEAAYLMQKELKLSLPRIGRVIGKRDHTTILHAIRRYKKRNKIEDDNES